MADRYREHSGWSLIGAADFSSHAKWAVSFSTGGRGARVDHNWSRERPTEITRRAAGACVPYEGRPTVLGILVVVSGYVTWRLRLLVARGDPPSFVKSVYFSPDGLTRPRGVRRIGPGPREPWAESSDTADLG